MKTKVELRHLRYFAAVAETCHFGEAAKRLKIAQSALSQAVRQLEDDLGVCLLARTTRRVELTAAGRFFLDKTQHALNRIDSTIRETRLLGTGQPGLVHIGLVDAATFSHMSPLVRSITKKMPGLEFKVHTGLSTQDQCERLKDETLDIGVVYAPLEHDDDVSVRIISSEPLVLVTASNHPLARKGSITVPDLRGEPFITCTEPVIAHSLTRLCLEAGFTPRATHEATSPPSLLALVAAGLGIGVVPASARTVSVPGTRFHSLPRAAHVRVALAWNKAHRSPLVSSLLDVLEEDLSEDVRTRGVTYEGPDPAPDQLLAVPRSRRS
ncbi:LysR substrate-binding domain-containing protein [Lentzea sp. NPDC058436]|uniref:LysR substrate-binding domain-containing protein n=1 Tax=Lentzea sp. NPDC058436 TaxID=3346499 RepID=UPI00365A9C9C